MKIIKCREKRLTVKVTKDIYGFLSRRKLTMGVSYSGTIMEALCQLMLENTC
jgi:hypothetical protein